MSIPAYNWVKAHPIAPNGEPYTPTERLVLYALAWHHNNGTGQCNPSVRSTLPDSTGIKSRSTIQRTLQSLARKGGITIDGDIRTKNPSPSSNLYTIVGLQPKGWPSTAAGGGPPQRQGVALETGQGGPPQRPVGEQEVEEEMKQEEKENPFSFSVSSLGDASAEPPTTWPEWIAIYTGSAHEGIMPGVEGGYLERCRTGESPPPCSLADLRAIIDLVRLCRSWVDRGPGKLTPHTNDLPGPGEIVPLAYSARVWREGCAVYPQWATSEGLADMFGYVNEDGTIKGRRTVEANAQRTGRTITTILDRERKEAEQEREDVAQVAAPPGRLPGRGRVRERVLSGGGRRGSPPPATPHLPDQKPPDIPNPPHGKEDHENDGNCRPCAKEAEQFQRDNDPDVPLTPEEQDALDLDAETRQRERIGQ